MDLLARHWRTALYLSIGVGRHLPMSHRRLDNINLTIWLLDNLATVQLQDLSLLVWKRGKELAWRYACIVWLAVSIDGGGMACIIFDIVLASCQAHLVCTDTLSIRVFL